ncbi:MAG: hypothetical protein OXE55_05160 [Flavobacteriaceae bacterium]|nr:hypothetical protein [Flavobacteriaceae bacterium]
MDKTLTSWSFVIQNCLLQNSYKLAWAKSIIECCVESPLSKVISLENISEKMFGYYWNLTFYYDFKQGLNPNKPPILESYVRKKIDGYKISFSNRPIKFKYAIQKINLNYEYMATILKSDVSHRFLTVDRVKYHLYCLNLKDSSITIPEPKKIKKSSEVLNELIYSRWSQFLETCNTITGISKKIKIC